MIDVIVVVEMQSSTDQQEAAERNSHDDIDSQFPARHLMNSSKPFLNRQAPAAVVVTYCARHVAVWLNSMPVGSQLNAFNVLLRTPAAMEDTK